MSKELTEKWKDGELDGGYYYLIMEDKTLRIDHTDYKFWSKTICWEHTDEHFVKEVLASVPTYAEFMDLMSNLEYIDKYRELVSKTEQLEKKLAIATKALSDIEDGYSEATGAGQTTRQALKEMEGVK